MAWGPAWRGSPGRPQVCVVDGRAHRHLVRNAQALCPIPCTMVRLKPLLLLSWEVLCEDGLSGHPCVRGLCKACMFRMTNRCFGAKPVLHWTGKNRAPKLTRNLGMCPPPLQSINTAPFYCLCKMPNQCLRCLPPFVAWTRDLPSASPLGAGITELTGCGHAARMPSDSLSPEPRQRSAGIMENSGWQSCGVGQTPAGCKVPTLTSLFSSRVGDLGFTYRTHSLSLY